MTTPNQQGQPDPPGTINEGYTWSEIQHKSEDDWKDEINAEWDTRFNPVQDGTNFLITIMLKLLASLLNMVPIVGGTLAQVVTNIANGLNQTNNTAVQAGSDASAAAVAAGNAQSTADGLAADVSQAQTDASNAASVAAAAQQTADIAYANAQQWDKEFQVSSAGVFLGVNELPAPGVILALPDDGIDRIRKITRVIYSLGSNTGTLTIELKRRTLAGAVSTVLTTNISSSATTQADNSIDFPIEDLDHYWCNVTAVGGTASVLNCALYGVLLED